MPASTLPLHVVPGPRGLPLLGNLPAFGKDPLAFLTRLRDDFGDAVTWSLGPRRSLFISQPRHIAELLAAREDTYEILEIGWAFKQITGRSVILSKGSDWRRKRSLVQPTVRPRQVRSYARTMVDCAGAAADGWRDGARIDVRREMALITQRVVLRTLFGNDLGQQTEALGEAMDVAGTTVGDEVRGIGLFLPEWVRTPSRRRLLAAVATIDAEVHRLIKERQETARAARPDAPRPDDERDDLLTRLLAARDEQGRPLSTQEVRNEAVTLWAAGHETTSTALTWAVHLLARAPEARARLEAELRDVLGGRPPTIDDYERLTWTQQIVKEATRLYPPVWLIPAVARDGATLGGTRIPAGTIVWCSTWTTHRDPRWFTCPDRFRPERWGADAPDVVPDHAWFPFGGGPRTCLGARFALVEAALVLATLAQRFHLDLPDTDVPPHAGLLLQPAGVLHATLRRRSAEDPARVK
ncbi:cytochrome P450 [Streptomyces sp. SDr-06]|uniref:cytochrome P450 n=1 Tax=Streptomyces sp. SDr-06 TaxID=2267702 RepID=UPI000DEAB858|nr:cytochrome P450 [Streptomyces sp. SDr-06]RCH70022.1 cytochrome P450 [Streptomyces sp. SDr-06]